MVNLLAPVQPDFFVCLYTQNTVKAMAAHVPEALSSGQPHWWLTPSDSARLYFKGN